MSIRPRLMLAGVLALAAGCNDNNSMSDSHGGGSRRDFWGRETTVRGAHGEKLTLVKPSSQSVRRGDAETVTIHVKRNGFSDPINVSLSQLPAGVEAVDTPKSVTGDSVEVVLRASPTADLVSNQLVMVTASGPNGMGAQESFKLTVRDR